MTRTGASLDLHRTRAARPGHLATWSAIVVAVVFVLAACGDNGTEADATTTTSPPVTSTTTDATTTTDDSGPPAVAATWSPVETGDVAPPARSGAVLAATPDGELWLHGGLVDDSPLGDLWRHDGEQWQVVDFDGGPSPRSEHVAVWDDAKSRLVIALGQGEGAEVFDDVWAFDPASGTWTELASGGPAARYGSCAVLDDLGRMVITHGFSTRVRFDDTWAFDLAGDAWSDITPATGPRPSARCLHACGYDPATGETLLFGGRNDEQPYLGDSWRLGSAGWEEIAPDGPSPRARSRGAFTTNFQVVGGDGSDGLPGNAWTLGDGGWEEGPSGAPADRSASAVAVADGDVWLFGGLGDAGPLDDLWRYG